MDQASRFSELHLRKTTVTGETDVRETERKMEKNQRRDHRVGR